MTDWFGSDVVASMVRHVRVTVHIKCKTQVGEESKDGRCAERESRMTVYLCAVKSDSANTPSWQLFEVSTLIRENFDIPLWPIFFVTFLKS